MPQKMPPPRSRYYDFLIIPADDREMRRFRVSTRNIRLAGAFVAVFIASFIGFVGGYLHYSSLHARFESERRANREFAHERGEALLKMQSLESVVASAEQYADNLATIVGTERPELRRGIGAVKAKMDWNRGESLTWDDLNRKVDSLQGKAKSIDLRIQELVQIQKNKLLYIASTPSIWPVKGWLTSEFGYRRSPITNERDFHEGIDIASQWGTAVMAPAAGVVTFSGLKGGLGRTVVIDHGFGIRSYFGHASQLLVSQGEVVTRGMQIARVGNSGHSTGPHLHYEIHVDGVPVDPMKYILQ